ncbi:MAG: hypothetical protein ACI4GB_02510 [Acutalibacteraceae bacterium]
MKESRKNQHTDLRRIAAVLSVIALYVLLVLFSGVIVGGDIGYLDTKIPGFVFFMPVILTAFSVFCGYYTKKKNDFPLYLCFLIPLLIPAVAYPLLMLLSLLIPEFVATKLTLLLYPAVVPMASLFTSLVETFDDLGMESDLLQYILSGVLLAIGVLACPVAHRLTKATENQA